MWAKMSQHIPQQRGMAVAPREGCTPKEARVAARQLELLAHLQGVSMLNKQSQGQM